MKVQYHSFSRCELVTVELTAEQESALREDYEGLPFHNGFADFEDFVICCLSYND